METATSNRIKNEVAPKKPRAEKPAKAELISPEEFGQMSYVTLRFTGVTSLMQQSSRGYNPEQETAGLKVSKKNYLTGAPEAAMATYPMDDGSFYHPADAFRNAMITAVVNTKIGKGSAPEIFGRSFFAVTERAILVHPETNKPLKDYRVDTRMTRNPVSGGLVPRSRPVWDQWAVEIEFEYDATDLDVNVILQAANRAGQRVGVGQLRPTPSKKNKKRGYGGRFGKFKAEIVK